MKKILAIAVNELYLLFKRGAGWGVVLLTTLIGVMMFFFARSDGVLLNELQIRIRYSLYFSTGLLNLILMYLACISLRKEIDTRRFHTVAAAPVHRFQIWLGKFLGLLTFGAITFLIVSAIIAVCSAFYIRGWHKPDEKQQLKTAFYRAYFSLSPQPPHLQALADKEYDRRQIAGTLPTGKPEWQVRKELYEKVRKAEQLVDPSGTREWTFTWNKRRPAGKYIILKTRFYADNQKHPIRGTWTLSAKDQSTQWTSTFTGYPYQFYELKIPVSKIPDSGLVKVTFTGVNTPYLIFPLSDGVRILYDNGSIFRNFLLMYACILCHFSTLITLSLTLCSFFSYSVAIFVNIVIYAIGSMSGFFVNVLRDLSTLGHTPQDETLQALFSVFIHLGLWLSKGIKAPPVIDYFSEGVSIPLISLFSSWGIGFLIYTLAVAFIGMVVLTRKEIDKELHT